MPAGHRRKETKSRPLRPAPARTRSRRWRLPALAGGALLIGAALLGIVRWRARPGAKLSGEAPGPVDSAARMTVVEAAIEARRLFRERRALESLPYYRRVAPEVAPGRLNFHLEFAGALQNASLEGRLRSRDRVRLMQECLDRLGFAERAVVRPRERARVIVARAFYLRVWGFPTDATAELRRAIQTDPTYPDLTETVRLMRQVLRDPTIPLEELQGPGGPSLKF